MSSNTNNLAEIFNEYTKKVVLSLGTSTEPVNTQRIFQARDEAIAAVLALLPEKRERQVVGHEYNGDGMVTMYGQTQEEIDGYNEAIDQTRRNLIGEQPGDAPDHSESSPAIEPQVDALLLALVQNFAFQDDEGRWWGMDTNLGKQEEAFAQAKKSIKELL